MQNTFFLLLFSIFFAGASLDSVGQTIGGVPHNITINNSTPVSQSVYLEFRDVNIYSGGVPVANTCGNAPFPWTNVNVPANSSVSTSILVNPLASIAISYGQSCASPCYSISTCATYTGFCLGPLGITGGKCDDLVFHVQSLNNHTYLPATATTIIEVL